MRLAGKGGVATTGLALAAAAAATALTTLVLAASGLLLFAERPYRDFLLRLRPGRPAAATALVLVDEESLALRGAWPWPRREIASLVDAARDAGARGVVLDLLLPEAREGDDLLAASLSRGPSVLAAGLDEGGRWILPDASLRKAAGVGHVSFDLDRDGVARRLAATKQAGGISLPALSVEGARIASPDRAVPVGASLRPGFRVRPLSVPVVAAGRIEGKGRDLLRGRIVFVGVSAAGIGDRVVDPVSPSGSPVAGVRVQAAATEAFLAGDLLGPVSPLLAALLSGILAAVAAGPRRPRVLRVTAALLPLVLAYPLLLAFGAELPSASIVLPVAAAAAVAGLLDARRASREAGVARVRITELEALSALLERERREDAEARRVVAHELKTPLTSVRGLAQLLSGYDLSPAERERVTALVVSETGRLAGMVDSLLDLERLKLHDFARSARPVDLSGLVAGRVAVLGGGGRVRGDVEPGLAVRGDARLLERVVDNLVGNALKFSPAGTPVDVGLRADGERGVLLEVSDEGPGVPPEERERIFGRFARGSHVPGGGDRPEVPGLGLGLSLVAGIVAWHGGEVDVSDGPRGGSLFRVRLPRPGASGAR